VSSLWSNHLSVSEAADGGVPARRLRAAAPEQAAQVRHCPRGGFFSIFFAKGRDYVLEEGPPDYGRAIGGNILTPLRRVG
jgi:hypothetical protein